MREFFRRFRRGVALVGVIVATLVALLITFASCFPGHSRDDAWGAFWQHQPGRSAQGGQHESD
ncbi:MAG: hypothetical protein J0I20_22765 [Chloroflexi bacterium]|nr:hypothetical protein [Chloroflexota bacterium]